jgi:sugar lactone lactonase YvrE
LTRLVTGLASGSGSTVGPGGDLYITEGATGRVLEIDPRSGEVSTFAEGLPPWLAHLGILGAMDVEFVGGTAYVLVTGVGPDLGGSSTVGVYRVDGPDSVTVVADIGTWSIDHPPEPAFFVPSGVPYSMESYRGDLIVADGHHNRVLQVTLDGDISEIMTFPNIVPTGLAIKGNTIYLAQAGPVPHLPENGKVVSFGIGDDSADLVASGARLLVDVEFGRGNTMYALAQGLFPVGNPEGSPALPNTGSLVKVNGDGTFSVIVDGLNQPTSLELIGNTAYIVTLGGEVWRVDDVSGPPHGRHHRDGPATTHAGRGFEKQATRASTGLLHDRDVALDLRADKADRQTLLR